MAHSFLIFLSLLSGIMTHSNIATLNVWEIYEVNLEADKEYGNAYGNIEDIKGDDIVTAVFRGISGEASGTEISITGFWDGGQTWKIRFAPPASGRAGIDLRDSDKDTLFTYRWFNPADGEYYSEGIVKGGDVREVSPPEDYPGQEEFRDWVLHLRKNQ